MIWKNPIAIFTCYGGFKGRSPLGEGEAASPRAWHRAEKEGLPLTGLSGSGPGGRILERDVEQALKERPRLTAAALEALRTGAVMPQAPGSGLGAG